MLQSISTVHKYLFWSAPVSLGGDFVIDDPLAFDYLGQQIGYALFAGLSTRTSRAQYFPVVLYGLSLVEKALEGRGADDSERKRLFERWERFWALAVHEYRGGSFERSDDDAVRGQRGVARAWKAGAESLPLDYKLISRQSELGGLGAYTTSLRDNNRLVNLGSLKPSLLAQPIIEAFWAEPGSGAKASAYEQYALAALDLDQKKIPRKYGAVTLAKVGELSRLSALVEGKRKHQQALLWRALFETAVDDTLRFADVVRLAAKAKIYEPRAVLEVALAGKLGALTESQADKLRLALAFGDVQSSMMTCFNRAFACALDHGWRVDAGLAATTAFGGAPGEVLRTACATLLDLPTVGRIRQMPTHGADFLDLVGTVRDATPAAALEATVGFHASIHSQRRQATPWLRLHEGRLVIDVGVYGNRAREEGTFPALKFNVVRSLLTDLGRLS